MGRQAFNKRWAEGVETQNSATVFKDPGDIRLATGWEGGQDKDAPPAGEENWWHNRVDTALQDLERRGAMTWHAQAIYSAGAPCFASDGYYYESLADNNAGYNPPSSSAYWRLIGASMYSSFSVAEYKDVAHNGSPDSGWLKCTGAVLLRAAYPKLFAKIGTTYNTGGELSTQFRLPDWRGMFPRFLDDGRGIDANRVLGNTPQQSQNLAHSHSASCASSGSHSHTSSIAREKIPVDRVTVGGNAVLGDQSTDGYQSVPTTTAGDHKHTISIGSSGGTEARSINLTQVRWIRYL